PGQCCDFGFFSLVLSPGLLRAALAEPAWAYHSHDLDTALPVLLAAARRGVPCVCDFHEWYAENVTYDYKRRVYRPHGRLKRWAFSQIERLAMRSASEVITVCDSIGEALEKQYPFGRKVAIIRNIPPMQDASGQNPALPLRTQLRLPADH